MAHEDARHVAAGAGQARHIAPFNRIEVDCDENNRRGAGSVPRGPQCRLVAGGEQNVHLRGKFAIYRFVSLNARRLDVLECEISALLIAELGHAPLERSIMWGLSRQDPGVTDAQHLRLLRPRRERQGDGSSAEQRDELAALHVGHGLPPAQE